MRHDQGRGAAAISGVAAPRLAATVGLAAVVIFGVALAAREVGPIPIEDRLQLEPTRNTVPRLPPINSGRETTSLDGVMDDIGLWSVIVSLVAVLLILFVVIRALVRRYSRRDKDPAAAPAPAGRPQPGGAVDHLRRASQHAEADLLAAAPGDVDDAVIAAWLRLEQAAVAVGTSRPPSATPTEFTVALLERHHADPDAMQTLLGLYQRARFGGAPLPAAAAGEATAALQRISATLEHPRSRVGAR